LTQSPLSPLRFLCASSAVGAVKMISALPGFFLAEANRTLAGAFARHTSDFITFLGVVKNRSIAPVQTQV
jgi:hypothetical protein